MLDLVSHRWTPLENSNHKGTANVDCRVSLAISATTDPSVLDDTELFTV